jgi:hypothetical protein
MSAATELRTGAGIAAVAAGMFAEAGTVAVEAVETAAVVAGIAAVEAVETAAVVAETVAVAEIVVEGLAGGQQDGCLTRIDYQMQIRFQKKVRPVDRMLLG